MFGKSLVLLAFAAVSAVAVPTEVADAVEARAAACPGYTPIKGVFNGGQTYIMDVNDQVANPGTWDWNTTKIFYGKMCETDRRTTHEVSFVDLRDCSPVPSKYLHLPEMDRNSIASYVETKENPTINVKSDSKGTVRFPCYNGLLTSFKYELHYRGWHRAAFLENLGYYDRIVSSP